MADEFAIADTLLGCDAGRIACVNLIEGVEEQLYSDAFAGAVLWWWGEYVIQTGKRGLAVADAMASLCDLADGRRPTGFAPPSPSLVNAHITCRRPDTISAAERRASVRDAAAMRFWATAEALDELSDDGIQLTARPGTPTYDSTIAKLQPSCMRDIPVDIDREATLTNANRGCNAIMFFTLAVDLMPVLAGRPFLERADHARDALGLVHIEAGVQQVLTVFDAVQTEARADRGRPTVVDSGGNTRFISRPKDHPADQEWGCTADLRLVPGGWPHVNGMPERICGPFPDYASFPKEPIDIEVHFLGAADVPRGDSRGRGDDVYAGLLEERWRREQGVPVRDRLIALMKLVAP